MMRLFVAFTLGFVLMMTILIDLAIIGKAWSADLAPPRKITGCFESGKPMPGDNLVLQPDKRCKSGLRWVAQK